MNGSEFVNQEKNEELKLVRLPSRKTAYLRNNKTTIRMVDESNLSELDENKQAFLEMNSRHDSQ